MLLLRAIYVLFFFALELLLTRTPVPSGGLDFIREPTNQPTSPPILCNGQKRARAAAGAVFWPPSAAPVGYGSWTYTTP